jgi:hypothetical protein
LQREAVVDVVPQDSPPRQARQAQQAQQSPVLSAATRGPAPSSSLDPLALARAAQLQERVSAQLTARKAGRPGHDGGKRQPQPGQQQQQLREQQGSPVDSCLDSAVPDSQLQRLSPEDAAAVGAPRPPLPSAQPTPQSRQRRLSPPGAQGKQQPQQQQQSAALAAARQLLAEQPVPRPSVGDRLLFGFTDLSRSELEVAGGLTVPALQALPNRCVALSVARDCLMLATGLPCLRAVPSSLTCPSLCPALPAEVKACEQVQSGFRLHISARWDCTP